MFSALLNRGDTNVVVVDWSKYSTKSYPEALEAAVNEVPTLVANMIEDMISKGYSIKKIHPIGFSLGATAVGYLGNQFKTDKFPLITGKY